MGEAELEFFGLAGPNKKKKKKKKKAEPEEEEEDPVMDPYSGIMSPADEADLAFLREPARLLPP